MKTRAYQHGFVSPVLLGRSLVLALLALVFFGLLRQYWYGEFGRENLAALQQAYDAQYQKNLAQQQKLDRLRADVADLKNESLAIEEHARVDLGLIKSGEVFVQISNAPAPAIVDAPKPDNKEPDAVEILDVMD